VGFAQAVCRCRGGGGGGGGERRERRDGSRGQARVAGWEVVGPRVDSTNFKGFFLQNRRQQVSAREGATDAPNSVVAAKAPPMLQILWWLQTGVGFKQP
jgi:hypothetical protein